MKNASYHQAFFETNEAAVSAFSAAEKKLLGEIIASGALPALMQWKKNTPSPAKKRRLLQTLTHLDHTLPLGLISYLKEAKELLKKARTTKPSPLSGLLKASLHPPQNKIPLSLEALETPEQLEAFLAQEKRGLSALPGLAVVLVAGGLGERLGAKELKLNLTANLFNRKTFLESYLDCLLALQRLYQQETGQALSIPLIFMTSPATHKKTLATLEKLSRKPMLQKLREHITVVQQTMVPALKDLSGQLAVEKGDLVTKPPGHGEIHALMHRHGIANRLKAAGKQWLFFVQDTNVQIMNGLLSGLGFLAGRPLNSVDFAWLTVPRKPQESMGVVGELRPAGRGRAFSSNLEYNLLAEGALGAEALKKYPGNTNSFFIRLAPYEKILTKTKGKLKHFVNPKFEADGVQFKKPCRLESLMQDLSHHFSLRRVVVAECTREWIYAPLKNQAKEAVASLGSEVLLTPAARENSYFKTMRQRLKLFGNQFLEGSEASKTTKGRFKPAARLTLNAAGQLSLAEGRKQMRHCVFHPGAVLVVEQTTLNFEAVTFSAGTALIVKGVPGTSLSAKNLRLSNRGYKEKKLSKTALTAKLGRKKFSAMELLAGKKITWLNPLKIRLPQAGEYELLPAGRVQRLKAAAR